MRRWTASVLATAIALLVAMLSLAPGNRTADADVDTHATAGAPPSAAPAVASHAAATITVRNRPVGRPIAPGFVGVSMEYSTLLGYTGSDPRAVNPVFEQLLRNLAPGQAPVLRIGGDSTDWTWFPVPGMTRPPGVRYTLTRRWLAVVRALATSTRARMILGVNLEADNPVLSGHEARALLHGVGTRHVTALEIGNEPNAYGHLPWYLDSSGQHVFARPRNYSFAAYQRDLARIVAALPPRPALAGPALGGNSWLSDLGRVIAAHPRMRILTDHAYPLNRCFTHPGGPHYPTIARLLSTYSSRQLAAALPPAVARAHRAGDVFRVDELQSVACGGEFGISNTAAAGLWALDAMFTMARIGVDGVNFHTFPKAAYGLFHVSRSHGAWRAVVTPEYLALLMFTQAAPPDSRLLLVRHVGSPQVRAWATRAPDGTVRVLLINVDPNRSRTVRLRLPVQGVRTTLERLRAPNVRATSGVRLGGAHVNPATGLLGRARAQLIRPVAPGVDQVVLPGASAALVTVAP